MKTKTKTMTGGIGTGNHNEGIRAHSKLNRDARRNRKDDSVCEIKMMSVHNIHKSRSL